MDKNLLIRFFEGQATTDEEMKVRKWTTNKYKILLFCISVDYNYIYGGE